MSKLIFGIRRCVPYTKEKFADYNTVYLEFISAYEELRKAVPKGDLMIHLYIEADSAEEVGAVFEDVK